MKINHQIAWLFLPSKFKFVWSHKHVAKLRQVTYVWCQGMYKVDQTYEDFTLPWPTWVPGIVSNWNKFVLNININQNKSNSKNNFN